jgi:hypothetical protein
MDVPDEAARAGGVGAGGAPAATSPAVALSGVSGAELRSVAALETLLAQRSVAIRAGALLEALAPRVRADAEVGALAARLHALAHGSAPGAPPLPPLARSARPQSLASREAGGSTLEPTGDAPADALAIAPHPAAAPLLLTLPVKPYLLDLALAGVPEAPPPEAVAPAAAAAPAKAAGGGGGGLFGVLFGGR